MVRWPLPTCTLFMNWSVGSQFHFGFVIIRSYSMYILCWWDKPSSKDRSESFSKMHGSALRKTYSKIRKGQKLGKSYKAVYKNPKQAFRNAVVKSVTRLDERAVCGVLQSCWCLQNVMLARLVSPCPQTLILDDTVPTLHWLTIIMTFCLEC